MENNFTHEDKNRITISHGRIRAFNESGESLTMRLDEDEEIMMAYETIAERVKTYRTPEQIERDKLTEFAIELDPDGAREFIKDWTEWTDYRVGEYLVYDGDIYRVVQSHRSQHDWLPDQTPALYTLANKTSTDPENPDDDGELPEWVEPTGGHDAYNKGDKVMYQGKAYESTIDGNTWNPADYPQGWKELG